MSEESVGPYQYQQYEHNVAVFRSTGEPYHASLADIEEINKLLKVLAITEISGSMVKKIFYTGFDGDEEERDRPFGEEVQGKIDELLRLIPDVMGAATADYPNDYTIGVLLELSPEELLFIGHRSEECGIICGDCSFGQAVPEQRETPGESCEHNQGEYEYIYDYWASLIKARDLELINRDGCLD